MNRILIAVIMLLTMVCGNEASAQKGTFFDTSNKLSSSFVKQVYQDRSGFLWVCTDNGLNRYDGYHFYSFGEADGLSSQNVNAVVQGADGILVVGTSRGISLRRGDKFVQGKRADNDEPLTAYINALVITPEGDVLACTSGNGLWRKRADNKFEHVYRDVNGLSFSHCAAFDHQGTLWAVTPNNGIISVARGRGGKEVVRTYKPVNVNNYSAICVDELGHVYVGFINGGIYRFDARLGQFVLYASTASLPVTSLVSDRKNRLLVGTDGSGMHHLDTTTGLLTASGVYTPSLNMDRTKVYSLYRDTHQNLWMGLMQKGVLCVPPRQSPFKYIGHRDGGQLSDACIMGVYRQKDGTLWVMSDQDGLYALNADGTLRRHYPKGQAPATVLSMSEDPAGRLWVGSFTDGCGWFDPASGQYHRLPLTEGKSQCVFDVRCDSKGRLWIGTLGDGLKCYDINTGAVKEFRAKGNGTNSPCNDYIVQMKLCPKEKVLLVGTAVGLSCLDIEKNSWTNILGTNIILDHQQINDIAYTEQDGLWVGTQSGIWKLDLEKRKAIHYGKDKGCKASQVSSIQIDAQHRLWLGTSSGLGCYTPNSRQYMEFYASDGLQGNEFSDAAAVSAPDGTMYFAGVSGLSFFNPRDVKPSGHKLNVTLSAIYTGGELVKGGMLSGRYEVCDSAVSLSDRFDFTHADNTLTFHFSTLSFTGADHVVYSYRINGEKWIDLPAGDNELRLARMQPGDYQFEVVATDNGVRSDVKEFLVVIHNPWYFTPFMRFVYLLLIAAAVWYYVRQLKVRNRERLTLQDHIHREELGEQRLQFFINMSHEIRTPMTLIVAPLMQLMKEDTDTARQATYEIIRRNADRIMHLVNQIMDLRKVDKGQMQMHMQETEAVGFVGDVVSMFRMQADARSINLAFDHKTETLPVYIDRQAFDKVVMNLMSNAVKYTPNGGKITVTLGTKSGAMQLCVANTGDHIAKEDMERIFERFYQTASRVNQNKVGTGVGLDLTRSFVEMHHGHIEVDNTDDGVCFTVYIPLGCDHLTEAELVTWDDTAQPAETTPSFTQQLSEQAQTAGEDTPAAEEQQAPAANKSRRPTVVVVDDDDEIRTYLTNNLASKYRVLSFADGSDAMPVILREVPGLIITDVMMPGIDGIELCAKVRANVNTNHVPVIMLTAKSGDEEELQGLDTGADIYLTKPFNMDILLRHVHNLLKTRRVMENKFTGKEDMTPHVDDVVVESQDERLLGRIMDVINQNLSNSDLNIDFICQEVGISRVHLHRKMKELTNQTPHDFIRNLRLKQAARLLARGGFTVSEVLYRCGFSNSTSFSTMFKRMYGVSPRDYAKSQAGNDEEE